jgi:general secretion pathway protein J
MTPATRRPPQGFTLIELLVAVSILSILAVMAWRALDNMQQGSTQAVLTSTPG